MASAATQPGPGLRPVLVGGELRYVPAPRRRGPEPGRGWDEDGGRGHTVAPLAFTVRYRAALVVAAVAALLLAAAALGPSWGLLLIIVTATCAVFGNLATSPRRPGQLSAYSIFNPHGETLPGQLRADHIEREIRGGFANVVGGGGGQRDDGYHDAGAGGRLLGGRRERERGAPQAAAPEHREQEDRDLQLALERSKVER